MSATAAMQGIRARLKTIDGLIVVTGEPTSIQRAPLAYVFYAGATNQPRDTRITAAAAVPVRRWRFGIRLMVSLQDNALAEDQLVSFADSVPDAVWGDPTLGGAANVTSAIEQSAEGPDGYFQVPAGDASVTYRSIVFRFEVMDKK